MFELILVLFLSYLLGSLPTAIIVGKMTRKIDIRDHGSGNAGATNVLRVLGWRSALVVMLVDMLKGFVAVQWLILIIPAHPDMNTMALYQILAGSAAIIGHIWTVFAGFRGGKGVGTAAGVFLGLQPLPVFICLLVFIGIVSRTRFVSLGSITAAFLLPIILIVENFGLGKTVPLPHIIVAVLLGILIIVTHRENISRLVKGEENKISFKKTEDA
ncbi:MAG: glycerol-3-phosphate 1-O-acyltransferase PlsY [Calditrichales bacterium]|nr:MAG: glycerol-3-phosphate 1-O-acyltransferase PlsY [Calditrichales bacterium]